MSPIFHTLYRLDLWDYFKITKALLIFTIQGQMGWNIISFCDSSRDKKTTSRSFKQNLLHLLLIRIWSHPNTRMMIELTFKTLRSLSGTGDVSASSDAQGAVMKTWLSATNCYKRERKVGSNQLCLL